MKSKILLSGLIIAGVLFSGCSSTTQSIAIPDISKPIPIDKSIIEIERTSSIVGGGRNPYLYSNDKLIGEIGNGGKLTWLTEGNKLECIYLEYNRFPLLGDPIIWDEKPIRYQCFTTKSGEIIKLELDFLGNRINKKSDEKELAKSIEITKISNISKADTKHDILALLKNAVTSELGDKLVTENASKSIELFIEEYQEGNAAKRWLAITKEGSTLLKVKVVIKKNNETIDTYITRLAIVEGGLLSVGADILVFNYASKDIASYLIGK